MKRLNHKDKFILAYVLTQVTKHMKKDDNGKYYDTGDIIIMLEPDEMAALKKITDSI